MEVFVNKATHCPKCNKILKEEPGFLRLKSILRYSTDPIYRNLFDPSRLTVHEYKLTLCEECVNDLKHPDDIMLIEADFNTKEYCYPTGIFKSMDREIFAQLVKDQYVVTEDPEIQPQLMEIVQNNIIGNKFQYAFIAEDDYKKIMKLLGEQYPLDI